ncbi:hypothetical protein Hdeb2414_s0058g00759241 [Helianthus debilis subsp. tardiflorus]
MRLKRKYLEVLDVLPCLPDDGLETFEEGDMLNRTAGGCSSPPSAPAGGVEQPAQDDTNVASDSADDYEEGNLNVLIAGIAKTAVDGDGASLRDVSIVSDTFPGNKKKEINKDNAPREFLSIEIVSFVEKSVNVFFILGTRSAAGGDDPDAGADEPDMGNVAAVTSGSADAGCKQAESLEGVNHGEDQLSVDTQGTVRLGDSSQVDVSVPAETRVGGSDVESPANVGKSGNEKSPHEWKKWACWVTTSFSFLFFFQTRVTLRAALKSRPMM